MRSLTKRGGMDKWEAYDVAVTAVLAAPEGSSQQQDAITRAVYLAKQLRRDFDHKIA